MKRYACIAMVVIMIITLMGACDDDSKVNEDLSGQNAVENGLSGGGDNTPDLQTGNIVVRLHDAPTDYLVKAVNVTIEGIEVHSAIAEQDQSQIQSGTGTAAADAVMEQDQERIQDQLQIHSGTGSAGGDAVKEQSRDQVQEQIRDQSQIHSGTGSAGGDAVKEQSRDQVQDQIRDRSQIHSGTGSAGEDAVRQQGNAQGWESVAISGSRTIDVLKYQDGLEALLGVQEMEAGKYTQVRLTVSEIEVIYMNESGTELLSSIAKLPGGQLKFVKSFDIVAGGTTVLSFDFDVEKSINFTGSGQVIVKPVVKLDVFYENSQQGKGQQGGSGSGQGQGNQGMSGSGNGNGAENSGQKAGGQTGNQSSNKGNTGQGAGLDVPTPGSPIHQNPGVGQTDREGGSIEDGGPVKSGTAAYGNSQGNSQSSDSGSNGNQDNQGNSNTNTNMANSGNSQSSSNKTDKANNSDKNQEKLEH